MNVDGNRIAGRAVGRGRDVGQKAGRRAWGSSAGGEISDAAAGVAVPCTGADLAGFGIDVGEGCGRVAADEPIGGRVGVGRRGDGVAFAILRGGAERLTDLPEVERLT